MPEPHPTLPPFWTSRTGLALVVAVAVAGFLLIQEHRAHFWGALPYLLLLACPLMHFFMHGGHGRHGGRREHSGRPRSAQHGHEHLDDRRQ